MGQVKVQMNECIMQERKRMSSVGANRFRKGSNGKECTHGNNVKAHVCTLVHRHN